MPNILSIQPCLGLLMMELHVFWCWRWYRCSYFIFFRLGWFTVTEQVWYSRLALIVHNVLRSLNTGTVVSTDIRLFLCSSAIADALKQFNRSVKAFFCSSSYGFLNVVEWRSSEVQLNVNVEKKRHGWGQNSLQVAYVLLTFVVRWLAFLICIVTLGWSC